MSAAPDRAEELFTEHSRRIYAYCLRQLGSPEEADDAVQATYLNACRSLQSGFEPDVAQAWLFKVAHNVCLTKQRSAWRRRRVESPEDIQEMEEFIPSPHEPGDELLGIDEALAALPHQQQRAILLREWQGLSYREVAAEMEITQAAVETLIFRARRSLAAALEAPEQPVTRRARFAHAFEGGALLASLKASLGGTLGASVATGLAVAASATAIAAGPAGSFDWLRPVAAPIAPAEHSARPRARPAERTTPADRDPSSVARENQGGSKGQGHGRDHGNAQARAKGESGHARGKPASSGKAAAWPQPHAGGHGKSNPGAGGKFRGNS
jgi:RNA polymerase sigma-70 factor (ECF subfamily)